MPDRETPEDPIEAIKRRNEERAAKLREKLAAEGAETFETSIDGTGEPVPTAAEEFDLGTFPPPPEPEEVPVGGEREAVIEPPTAAEPGFPDIELPPPPEAAEATVPDIEVRPEAPDLEIEITPPEGVPDIPTPVAAETPGIGPGLDIDIAPPDITEIPAAPEEAAKIADIELPDEAEFPLPEAWEGAEVPEVAVTASEAPEPAIEPPVEPVIGPPSEPPGVVAPAAEAIAGPPVEPPAGPVTEPPPEPVTEPPAAEEEIEPSVVEGLELPEIPPIEVPVGEIAEPVVTAAEPPEAVELPPEPVEPEPAEVAAEEPLAVEPTVTEPVVVGEPVEEPSEEELTLKVVIEVRGTKVRIARENIALDGAVDLFRKIIERYENR
jgi:hypothetical protein